MDDQDHLYWGKKILAHLVLRIKEFEGGDKFITYGTLAKEIGYPEPHIGSLFANNIGHTLGAMGHLFEDRYVDGVKVPMIQALVVNQAQHIPSNGLKEFYPFYPELTTTKKRDFANSEYIKVFEFGSRWEKLLGELGIVNEDIDVDILDQPVDQPKLYNPYGSEGSPEHIALRNFIADNPSVVSLPSNLKGVVEYPIKSGGKVDVVFISEDLIVAIEVKSIRSGTDDIERGLFQCVKYKAVLEAENKVNYRKKDVNCILVLQESLPTKLIRVRDLLGISVLENIDPI